MKRFISVFLFLISLGGCVHVSQDHERTCAANCGERGYTYTSEKLKGIDACVCGEAVKK